MSNKKPVDKAEVLLAKEKIKRYRTPNPLKSALLLALVLGLFMNFLFGFKTPNDFERVNESTKIKKYGAPFAYREWSETTCPGHIFKICEKGETRFSLINFLLDWVFLGGVSFLIAYLILVWNIQGPPWKYYSRFDFEK